MTDYVWSSAHGGLLSVAEPLAGLARPETRIAYAGRNAYFRDSPTSYTSGSTITLPISTSACANGKAPACLGGPDETRIIVAYESGPQPSNLLPIESLITSGEYPVGLQAITAFTYDRNSDLLTVDGPMNGDDVTTYRYDSARRLTGVIGPDPDGGGPGLNRARRVTLNDRNQPTLIEAGSTSGTNWATFTPLQRQSTLYGSYARPSIIAQETLAGVSLTKTQFSYDAVGRIDCTAVRMNGEVWHTLPASASACTAQSIGGYGPDRIVQNTYDAAGRVVSTTSGLGSSVPITEGVTYTPNGQIATLTDGRSSTSAMEYDGFDRMVRLRYPDPSTGAPSTTDDELYTYDANANPVTFTDRANQVFTTTWDALNRASAVAAPSPMPSPSFTYDNFGQTRQASIPGLATSMTWDALGRQRTETGPTGTMTYDYDPAGLRIGQTWPDGFNVTHDWNLAGEMTSIRRSGAAVVQYVYDDLGRRTALGRANGVGTTYAYDGISRLASLTHHAAGNVTLGFEYNPANQIMSRTMSNTAYAYAGPTGSTSYVLDRLNRITSASGTPFSYDANSNLTNDGVRTYSYDAASRLTGGGSPVGTLSYDALGRLDTLVGGLGGRYVYDGSEAAALADPSTNAITNHFVRGPGIDEIAVNYPSGSLSNPLFWLLDHQNSMMGAADASGAMVFTNGYDEFGQPRAGNLGRFQYTGQLSIPDFGAYHYKARAYAPNLGRFLQTDPSGYSAGANLYGYVGGDPMNFTDPLGLVRYQVCFTEPIMDAGSGAWTSSTTVCTWHETGGGGGRNGGFDRFFWDGWYGGGRTGGSIYEGGFGGCGSDCRGGPVTELPEFNSYNELRLAAIEDNAWMVDYALAPFMVLEAPFVVSARASGAIAKACSKCFVADTPVQTSEGSRPIQDIQVGDLVLSRDEATGETAFKPVVGLIAGTEKSIWEVIVETIDEAGVARRETIGTTFDHPWRLVGGQWRETAELEPGDQLVSADGRLAAVVSVLQTERVEQTYNFEVEGFNTYFVGNGQLWVHNACSQGARFFTGALRRLILRPRARCTYCGNPATQVDHIVPWARGGRTELSNGTPACASCNASKGAQDLATWLARRFGQ